MPIKRRILVGKEEPYAANTEKRRVVWGGESVKRVRRAMPIQRVGSRQITAVKKDAKTVKTKYDGREKGEEGELNRNTRVTFY